MRPGAVGRRAPALVPVLGLALCIGALSVSGAQEAGDDLARTFTYGRVHALRDGALHEEAIGTAWPWLQRSAGTDFRATIVYLHGCDGIGPIGSKTADLLAVAGHLVIMPDSFARRNKPTSCEPLTQRAGLHREVLGWRQAEADLALARARTLPGGESRPLVLMGFSEGGIAAATYNGRPLDARVIEGWTCHAGWPEYRGLNAPASEAVLALLAEHDPWFTEATLRGDCGAFLGAPSDRRRSIVFRPPHPAASQHDLLWNLEARRALLGFLDTLAPRRSGDGVGTGRP